jgi:hypothetical protein
MCKIGKLVFGRIGSSVFLALSDENRRPQLMSAPDSRVVKIWPDIYFMIRLKVASYRRALTFTRDELGGKVATR